MLIKRKYILHKALFYQIRQKMLNLLFQRRAKIHNAQLNQEIKATIEEGAIAELNRSHLDEYELNGLFLGMKEVAFEMVWLIFLSEIFTKLLWLFDF